MSDDLSQLDQLIESDVLEALGQDISGSSDSAVDDGLVQNIPEEYNTFDSEIDTNKVEEVGEVIEDIGDIEILPMAEIESALDNQEEDIVVSGNNSELVSILSQLLNNKTIEITIKIKE